MPCPYCAATTTTEMPRRTTLGYRMFRCRACRRTYNERTGTPFNHLGACALPLFSAGRRSVPPPLPPPGPLCSAISKCLLPIFKVIQFWSGRPSRERAALSWAA